MIATNHPLLQQLPGGKLRLEGIHAFSKGLVLIFEQILLEIGSDFRRTK